jgi:hypothetical protein
MLLAATHKRLRAKIIFRLGIIVNITVIKDKSMDAITLI